jgi:hypothetical protein
MITNGHSLGIWKTLYVAYINKPFCHHQERVILRPFQEMNPLRRLYGLECDENDKQLWKVNICKKAQLF